MSDFNTRFAHDYNKTILVTDALIGPEPYGYQCGINIGELLA